MNWPLILPAALLWALCIIHTTTAVPNSTSSGYVETTNDDEVFKAEGSEFFPSEQKSSSSVTFPDGTNGARKESTAARNSYSTNEDEQEANEAIEAILQASRQGRKLDFGKEGDEIAKLTSDAVIQEQLAVGNEAEARGYIRSKLCDLGLMEVRIMFHLRLNP